MRLNKLIVIVFSLFLVSAYSMNACAVSKSDSVGLALNQISNKSIFFAHQSVGGNILDGIRDLSIIYKKNIKIISFDRNLIINGNGLYHNKIGANGHPMDKIDDFYNKILEAKEKPDIVFLKLCFVDVTASTNVSALFLHYSNVFDKIRDENPDIQIVHFTVPLKENEVSWKTSIKTFLGLDAWEYADNIKRNQFNKLLLQKYSGNEAVFDIAKLESTGRNGERAIFTHGDHDYLALSSEYSLDGGHLNKKGRQWIAENLIIFLNEIH